jgi:hypothetical protein
MTKYVVDGIIMVVISDAIINMIKDKTLFFLSQKFLLPELHYSISILKHISRNTLDGKG